MIVNHILFTFYPDCIAARASFGPSSSPLGVMEIIEILFTTWLSRDERERIIFCTR
jgi:hypothetical protein